MFNRRRAPIRRAQDGEDTTPNTPINWRRLLGYLYPYRGRMALAIVALALTSAMSLAFPLVIVRLLDSVLTQRNQSQLNHAGVGVGCAFLVAGHLHLLSELQFELYRRVDHSRSAHRAL